MKALQAMVSASGKQRDDEPITGSAARQFSLEAKGHLERYLPIVKAAKGLMCQQGLRFPQIIDLGCGPAILSAEIAKAIPGARVTGIDLSSDMLEYAKQTVVQAGVAERFRLHQHDMRNVATDAGFQADLVVSRNAFHRVDGLQDVMARAVLAAKPSGGMVLITAFRNLQDLDTAEQAAFIQAVQERQGQDDLITAFVRAYLNAPTHAQYQAAAQAVARRLDLADMEVKRGKHNNEILYFKRKV